MPLTKQLSEQAEREKLEEDLTSPPGGRRTGEGTASILPHLSRTRRASPGAQHDAGPSRPDADPQRTVGR